MSAQHESRRSAVDVATKATISRLRDINTYGDAEQEAACFAHSSERQLIACLVAQPEQWAAVVASGLHAEDCTLAPVRVVVQAWLADAEHGGPIVGNELATFDTLQASGALQPALGESQPEATWGDITPLFSGSPVVPDAALHAASIINAARYRKTRLALLRALTSPPDKVDTALVSLRQARSKQSTGQPKAPNVSKMPNDALSENEGTIARGGHLRTVGLDTVEPELVEWLDKGYIPRGKITGIIGDPGLGKSTLTLHYVACHTTGEPMPGGTQNAPAHAVLMSAEDGLADTIVPRLLAAGADLSRVTALTCFEAVGEDGQLYERSIFLPRDIPRIRAVIEKTSATLLVIDPLTAYLDPDVNSHRDQDVRTALAPLARMADETGCAVVLVRHLNKASGGNTLYRGGGSIGITGAERAELVVALDPDDDTERVVATHKHNLHKDVPALTFELLETTDERPYVHFLGTSEHTAAQLLAAPVEGEERSATDECTDWLREQLAVNGGCTPKTPNATHTPQALLIRCSARHACASVSAL